VKPDSNPLEELLDNIDRLTLPNRSKIMQDEIPGQPPKTAKIVLPALLTQLEDAIRGTVGIGGSGALASERNMLDADALLRFMTIKAQIGEWARKVGETPDPMNPASTLRAWYVKWVSTPQDIPSVKFYRGQTAKWVKQIDEKLDPPRVRELPDRCPSCNAFTWWNPVDRHEYNHPLIVEYRHSSGASMVEEATGKCRACASEWGVRQLAYELEQMFLHDWDEALEHDTLNTVST
jgi:hypothetical protein